MFQAFYFLTKEFISRGKLQLRLSLFIFPVQHPLVVSSSCSFYAAPARFHIWSSEVGTSRSSLSCACDLSIIFLSLSKNFHLSITLIVDDDYKRTGNAEKTRAQEDSQRDKEHKNVVSMRFLKL